MRINKKIMLTRFRGTIGYKNIDSIVPNMKLGEYGYFPDKNPNLTIYLRERITRKAFDRILKRYLPKYSANLEIDNSRYTDPKYHIGSVGIAYELKNGGFVYQPIVTNKGYICIKEATPKEDGTILSLRNGIVMPYKEHYIEEVL